MSDILPLSGDVTLADAVVGELPHLFQWKMMGEGAYVLGIEPANSSGINGRAAARQSGDLAYLAPGQSVTYDIAFEIFELSVP